MYRYPRPVSAFGRFVMLMTDMVVRPERPSIIWRRTMEEAVLIGTDSVFIVGLVATFITSSIRSFRSRW
jgi:phospholipid/cholesterol/gamma-HCH transport system permease protein